MLNSYFNVYQFPVISEFGDCGEYSLFYTGIHLKRLVILGHKGGEPLAVPRNWVLI